jgi:hypothetical protein
MLQHKQQMYLFLTPCEMTEENPKGYTLKLSTTQWGTYTDDEINLTQEGFEVVCDVPNFSETELMQEAIKTLEAKQKNVMAEAVQRQTRLQEMINKLILIEYKPALKVVGDKPF